MKQNTKRILTALLALSALFSVLLLAACNAKEKAYESTTTQLTSGDLSDLSVSYPELYSDDQQSYTAEQP